IYSDWIYSQKSRDAEWWERSMGQVWIRCMEVARQYHMPMKFETIQYFRAAFSYDAIVNRLNKAPDINKEYRFYLRQAAKEARERMRRKLKRRICGPTDMDYLRIEEFGDMVSQLGFQLQRNIENPIIHFRTVIGKIAYILRLLLRLGYFCAAAFGVAVLVDAISKQWLERAINWPSLLENATSFGWVQLVLVLLILVVIRRIVIRLSMPDTRPDSE